MIWKEQKETWSGNLERVRKMKKKNMTKKKTKERKVKMDERQTSGGRSSRGDDLILLGESLM